LASCLDYIRLYWKLTRRLKPIRPPRPAVIGSLCCAIPLHADLKELKPGYNSFSPSQDVQLGKEAEAKVFATMPVVHNKEVDAYLARLGARLQKSPRAGKFPFSYHLIYSKDINAFALPGGPIFVNTATILAAENEAQLVGILAHEMSHVALRHSTHEASRRNILSIPAALVGAVLGGSMLGDIAQAGLDFGVNSVFLHFSRADESQADYNGAQMMADAGYNPLEMAHFFEMLEAKTGKQSAQFLSDHPNPGNRVKAVEDEIRQMPQQNYDANTGEFPHIQDVVRHIPAPGELHPHAAGGAVPPARPSANMATYDGAAYSFDYPENWEVFGGKDSSAVTIAPGSGLVRDPNGQTNVGYGLIANFYSANGSDLDSSTSDLIAQLESQNRRMKVWDSPRLIRVANQDALETLLNSQSPYPNEQGEVDLLVTLQREGGLFYLVFVTPKSEFSAARPVYEAVIKSIHFH